MTKDDFLTWKDNPVTQLVFKAFKEERVNLCSDLLDYSLLHPEPSMDEIYSKRGSIRTYDAVLDVDYEWIAPETDNEPQ